MQGTRLRHPLVVRTGLLAVRALHGLRLPAGDEVGKSHGGNNNWYGHDGPMAHLQWAEEDEGRNALLRFCSELIKLRNMHPALRRENFMG